MVPRPLAEDSLTCALRNTVENRNALRDPWELEAGSWSYRRGM